MCTQRNDKPTARRSPDRTYSNGIVFDATAKRCYIADDCTAKVHTTRRNPNDKSLKNLKSVFEFPCETATTNYPSGMVIDRCSNLYVGDHNSGLVYYVNPEGEFANSIAQRNFSQVCNQLVINSILFENNVLKYDDQAVSSKSKEGATRSIDLVQDLFRKIGLEINPKKSQAIVIVKGRLAEDKIVLSDGSEIVSIKVDEKIKYLGCSFTSELIFDDSTVEKLNKNLNKLSTSPLLKPDQKLNIVNQYIFPTLIYPLRTAPINKIPSYVTDGLDIMIRRTIKEYIGLPMRTNDNLFYAPRKLRGLGLLKTSWEVHFQHFAIAKKLSNIDDGLFHTIYDCSNEMSNCFASLNVDGDSTKALRQALRQKCYENWCSLKYQGSGAIHFQTYTPSNDFIYNKNTLSSSEWVASIKLNSNYANLNGVPGNVSTSALCRKYNREIESIAHVTGSCQANTQLITARHHKIKHQLKKLLEEKKLKCFEEVHAIDSEGRSRFSDIVAFDTKLKKAYIIDPTIRYETNDPEQDTKIANEKSSIYEGCIPFYKEKYKDTYDFHDWTVKGLWFGSRGTFGNSVLQFFDHFKLNKSNLKSITEEILSATIHIIHNHIYN